MNMINRLSRGAVREDGLVLLGYIYKKLDDKNYFLFENWVTLERFENNKIIERKSRIKCSKQRREFDKKHYRENRAQIRKARLEYWKKYHSNPTVKKRNNERRKFLLNNNKQYRIAYDLRRKIRYALKYGKGNKTDIENIVGCSIPFLRHHFEKQFRDGMCWENPKSFHIDHIRPLSHFDLTNPENIKISCNWRNLQPLLPIENMMKGKNLTIN